MIHFPEHLGKSKLGVWMLLLQQMQVDSNSNPLQIHTLPSPAACYVVRLLIAHLRHLMHLPQSHCHLQHIKTGAERMCWKSIYINQPSKMSKCWTVDTRLAPLRGGLSHLHKLLSLPATSVKLCAFADSKCLFLRNPCEVASGQWAIEL